MLTGVLNGVSPTRSARSIASVPLAENPGDEPLPGSTFRQPDLANPAVFWPGRECSPLAVRTFTFLIPGGPFFEA
jgi:hypothetical protein